MTVFHTSQMDRSKIRRPQRTKAGGPTRMQPPTGRGQRQRHRSDLQQRLLKAVNDHKSGRLSEAAEGYRDVLSLDPNQSDALDLLGVLHHQSGDQKTAIQLIERAIELNSARSNYFNHLGEAFRAIRQYDRALTCFAKALELLPNNVDALCNLAHVHAQQGQYAQAEPYYQRAVQTAPHDATLYNFLGICQARMRRRRDAITSFETALQLDPQHEEASLMLAALRGQTLQRSPENYVAELFDNYADSFDEHLVKDLRYCVPEIIRSAIETHVNTSSTHRIIDIGCGTGLCGRQIRHLASHLVGIDLSARMLQQAQSHGVYDELIVEDVTECLRKRKDAADVIVAGDVLAYFGALDELFESVAHALGSGGVFVFSTEHTNEDSFKLGISGRFAHSEQYVRDRAGRFGFEVTRADVITSRYEEGQPVEGQVFVLRTS